MTRRLHKHSTLLKVGVYTAVMLTILGGLIIVFGNFRSDSANTYRAVFTDASGLRAGQNVRIAGVLVGKVSAVDLQPDSRVVVTFSVTRARSLDSSTHAQVKYENLTGDRYLEIAQGQMPPGSTTGPLSDGGTIPAARTAPALDIDALVGGLKPVFRTVRAEDLNKLTGALVGIMQGQGENIQTLLDTTASTTGMLADQDAVIGEVVDNLNVVLNVAADRRQQVSDSVSQLQLLVTQFAHQQDPMDQITERLSAATLAAGGLLDHVRPDAFATVVQLDRTAGQLVAGQDMLDRTLAALPEAYRRLGRMGAYGAGFQLYACQGILRLTGTDGKNLDIPLLDQTEGRCSKGDVDEP